MITVIGGVFVGLLFLFELSSYLSPSFSTSVVMDSTLDSHMKVYFNVTFPSLPCQYAEVDVEDALKYRKLNVTKNIRRWALDAETLRRLHEVNKPRHLQYAESMAA